MARNTGRRSAPKKRRQPSSGITREEYIRRQMKRKESSQMDELLRRANSDQRVPRTSEKRALNSNKNNGRNRGVDTSKRNRITGKKRVREPINIDDDIELTEEEKKAKIKKAIRKKVIKIVSKILLVVLIILFIMLIVSLVKWNSMAHDMIKNVPSTIVDINGDKIGEIGTKRNRENISINDMPDNLKNAYVSIEDQRFYKHGGVDIKRTGAATINYITSFGKASFGGSTITQQLVKNLTGNNDAKISRKFDEWTKAVALEISMSKDEILEAYLNIIYVGPNIYGVEKGAEYYFSKDAKDLSLEECAFLAGLNNAPNAYNPFRENEDNTERINKRTKVVLGKMKELNYINEADYKKAVEKVDSGLKFKRGDIEVVKQEKIYSYHTDALILELVKDIASQKRISEAFASNYLEMAGLKVYSTQNPNLQKKLEEEFNKNKYILRSEKNPNSTSQAAMVLIDNSTGYVVATCGGLRRKK